MDGWGATAPPAASDRGARQPIVRNLLEQSIDIARLVKLPLRTTRQRQRLGSQPICGAWPGDDLW
jgi:hypothetical protein